MQAPGTVLAALHGSAQWFSRGPAGRVFLPSLRGVAWWRTLLGVTQPVGREPRADLLPGLWAFSHSAAEDWFTRVWDPAPGGALSVKTGGYMGVMQAARDRSQARDRASQLSCNSDHHPSLTRSRLDWVPLWVPAKCLKVGLGDTVTWFQGHRVCSPQDRPCRSAHRLPRAAPP